MSQCRCRSPRSAADDDEGFSLRKDDSSAQESAVLGGSERGHQRILASLKLPREVEEAVSNVDTPVAIVFMRQGCFMAKYPKSARFHKRAQARMFKADMDNLTLKWLSPRKPSSRTYLPFTTVVKIIPGVHSSFFKEAERELGIELISKWRKLRLVCSNAQEWRLWMRGMCYMLEKADTKRRRGIAFQKNDYIRHLWELGDSDKSGSLMFSEVTQLTKKINLTVDKRYIASIFHHLDQDRTNVLDYLQFREMIHSLVYSSECSKLFALYTASHDEVNAEGIQAFLLDVQKEKPHAVEMQIRLLLTDQQSLAEALPQLNDTPPGCLNEFNWCRLLMSEWNSIVDVAKLAHGDVDMSQPLTQFWIQAADDPFAVPRALWARVQPGRRGISGLTDASRSRLTQNSQRSSELLLSAQPVRRAPADPLMSLSTLLMRGVRFLRLRLIPGDAEEDSVTIYRRVEDRPLTGDDRPAACVDFRAFLATLKESAFLTSPYPVILLLDFLNCDWAQRAWAVRTVGAVCGEAMVYTGSGAAPPTVEALMKKVLVCTAVCPDFSRSQVSFSGTEADLSMLSDVLTDPVAALKFPPKNATASYSAEIWKELNETEMMTTGSSTKASTRSESRADEISKLVAIRARSFASDPKTPRAPMDLYSLSIYQLLNLAKSDRDKAERDRDRSERDRDRSESEGGALCLINTRTLGHCCVTGPSGFRLTHSFSTALACGVHCVSVPHSSDGMVAIMQQALFWQNGNTGYVGKPGILSNPQFDPFRPEKINSLHSLNAQDSPVELRVTVVEGRQIPRGPLPLISKVDRLCPFVSVGIRGLPADCSSFQTRPVMENGFAPRWDAPEFVYRVSVPTLSFLTFEVKHYDLTGAAPFLAGAAFVVSTLRQGLRWVTLRDQWSRRVPWSGLLVKVSLRPLKYEQSARPHVALPSKLKLDDNPSSPKDGLTHAATRRMR